MSQFIQFLAATRLGMLFFSVPYAVLWMKSPASGGALMVIAHALLVLLYFLSLDVWRQTQSREPILALVQERGRQGAAFTARALPVVGVASGVVIVVLIFAQLWVGVTAAAAAALIGLMVLKARSGSQRWRFRLAEFLLPGVMLLGPALLIRAFSARAIESRTRGTDVEGIETIAMSSGVIGATVLGSLMLGIWVLISLIRDGAIHASEGIHTTATSLGRRGAGVVLAVWLGAAVLLAISGSGEAWSWWVGGTAAVSSLLVVWGVSSRRDDVAMWVWTGGHALTATILAATV